MNIAKIDFHISFKCRVVIKKKFFLIKRFKAYFTKQAEKVFFNYGIMHITTNLIHIHLILSPFLFFIIQRIIFKCQQTIKRDFLCFHLKFANKGILLYKTKTTYEFFNINCCIFDVHPVKLKYVKTSLIIFAIWRSFRFVQIFNLNFMKASFFISF